MIRGFRGATTVTENNEQEIMQRTMEMVAELAERNHIKPEDIVNVFLSATSDVTKAFPAKALRAYDPAWKFVPVMCMQEMNVEGGLEKCIRIMLTAETALDQAAVHHVYHYEARKLRPDLTEEEEK